MDVDPLGRVSSVQLDSYDSRCALFSTTDGWYCAKLCRAFNLVAWKYLLHYSLGNYRVAPKLFRFISNAVTVAICETRSTSACALARLEAIRTWCNIRRFVRESDPGTNLNGQ